MNRRELLRSGLIFGFSGVSLVSDDYFEDWEKERIRFGTHYWLRERRTFYQFKDYEEGKTVSAYTIHEVGEMDEYIINREVGSKREAARLVDRLRVR